MFLFPASILLASTFATVNVVVTTQLTTKPSTEMNSSALTNTTYPKVLPNATVSSNIVSNTTQQPTTAAQINSGSFSNTPHPKVMTNESTQIPKNASAPKNTINSNLGSNTSHPRVP